MKNCASQVIKETSIFTKYFHKSNHPFIQNNKAQGSVNKINFLQFPVETPNPAQCCKSKHQKNFLIKQK